MENVLSTGTEQTNIVPMGDSVREKSHNHYH